jgi:transposase
MTHDDHIRALQRAARLRRDSDRAWREAIVSAHRAGMSYREIAKHAGISHSRVQQIVNDAKGD